VDEILKTSGAEARAKELFEGRFGPGGVDRSVRHIVFSTDAATSQAYTRAEYERDKPLVLAAAQQTAEDVRASLLKGGDLNALAKIHSDDFSASRGGALDVNWSGRFGKAFDDAVAQLQVGQISPVVRGRRGLHVARVDGLRLGARYVGAYLLVSTKSSGPKDTRDEATRDASARKKAARLAGLLRSGSDFARLSREHSDDPATAGKGGALGAFGPGRLGPTVDRALETMKVGAVSAPIDTPNGVVLVQLSERERRPDQDRKRVSHVFVSTEFARVKARRLEGRLEVLARERAERVAGTARQPDADFAALAKAHSEDMSTRGAGGRIARYRPGQLGPAVDAAIARMTAPGTVEVVRGPRGWHVVRLDGLKRSDFAKVRDKLLAEARATPPRAEDREAYLKDLEGSTKVEKLF
jgi:parvulin-like peptidyl-prolyl isomerase